MWVFLSRRLRLWLLLAVGVPLTRSVLQRASGRTAPDSRTGRTLRTADLQLGKVDRRRRRR